MMVFRVIFFFNDLVHWFTARPSMTMANVAGLEITIFIDDFPCHKSPCLITREWYILLFTSGSGEKIMKNSCLMSSHLNDGNIWKLYGTYIIVFTCRKISGI